MSTTPKPVIEPVLPPARELRTMPIEDVEWRQSGAGDGQLTVRGHASVFGRLSLDLGGFRERIAKGAFTNVLDRNPDVHALWDHNTALVLARTKNKTLELREDPIGLHFWAKVADTTYAKDLRLLMERGDVDQASFGFTVARDEWEIDDEENVTRTILEVGELYDVTVTAQGAYAQTDASVVAHMRSRIKAEIREGHLPAEAAEALPKIVAPEDPADTTSAQPEPGLAEEERPNAPDEPVVDDSPHLEEEVAEETRTKDLAELKAHTAHELEVAKRRLLDAENERKRR